MKQSEDKIIFEVQETLFFESGQEISEMVSISLDPDIVVQAYKDYIQIRGIILLQGEYKKEVDSAIASPKMERAATIRYIENVIDGETELAALFSHRFPVEISVPTYRVKDLSQISVSVEAFDYELPSSNKLHVQASLEIHGINPEPTVSRQTDTQREMFHEDDAALKNVKPSVQPSRSETQALHIQKDSAFEETNTSKNHPENISSPQETETNREEKRVIIEDSELRNADEQANLIDDDFETEANSTEIQEVDREENVGELTSDLPDTEEGIGIQYNEQVEEADETEVKDVAFLAELFNSDEEIYTKMKIYIAQDDDTIESIAKRYEVPVLQLMKDNELSADSLEGGQLIKIPIRNE